MAAGSLWNAAGSSSWWQSGSSNQQTWRGGGSFAAPPGPPISQQPHQPPRSYSMHAGTRPSLREATGHAYAGATSPGASQPDGEFSSYWRNLLLYPFQGSNGSMDNGYAPNARHSREEGFGSFFGGLPAASSFSLLGRERVPPEVPPPPPRDEPLTIESIERLPGNQECADCGASGPEWASTNQGTVICIDCAGVHRSLGAHISKVKSLRLDAWKPQEIRVFKAKGGNREVNKKLADEAGLPVPRLPPHAPRSEVNKFIHKKYRAMTTMPRTHSMPMHSRMPAPAVGQTKAGTTCHAGVCFVETVSVEISDDRARDLRVLGSFFLSLSVTYALGSKTSQATAAKRMSPIVRWDPPERREILWDCEERWLWCRVNDGEELIGVSQLAGEGRVDIKAIAEHQAINGKDGSVEVAVDLFAPGGDEESEDEADSSRTQSEQTLASERQYPDGFGDEARMPAGASLSRNSGGIFGGLEGFMSQGGFGPPPPPVSGYPQMSGNFGPSASHYYASQHMSQPPAFDSAGHPLGGPFEPVEEDPTDPAVYGCLCGVARLRITLIDMSGMASGQPAGGQRSGPGSHIAHGAGGNDNHGSGQRRDAFEPGLRGGGGGNSAPHGRGGSRQPLWGDAEWPPPPPPPPPRIDRRSAPSNGAMWGRPPSGAGYQDQHMTL